MLGSLIRLLAFLALVVGGTWAVTELLAVEPVTIRFQGVETEITAIAAVAIVLGGFIALYLAFRLLGLLLAVLRFLTGDETALTRTFRRGREKRGLDALARGWTAVAAGDAKEARKQAEKAQRLLDRPDLTRLLNARAADLAGDTRRAKRYYKALAAEPETAFVGVKGLLGQAMRAGETDRALRLAEHAFAIRPEEPEVLDTLYQLQSQAFDWKGARRTLGVQRKIGLLEAKEANRRDATLALALAEDADTAESRDEARRLAIEAARTDPANPEAVVAAARHLASSNDRRGAARQIVEAWAVNPDPRLAAAFAEIEPHESLERRRRRFARLYEANPTHRETHFLKAEMALLARDWAGAREAIDAVEEEDYSARTCAIMAAIARGEEQPDTVVRGWLARALGASRSDASDSEIGHAAMLPLLVGDPDDAEDAAGHDREETGAEGDTARAEDAGSDGQRDRFRSSPRTTQETA